MFHVQEGEKLTNENESTTPFFSNLPNSFLVYCFFISSFSKTLVLHSPIQERDEEEKMQKQVH